jgi:short-subunit dehydrogenase
MKIYGKTVLITGAAGGLGQALSGKMIEYGANVIAVDVDKDALDVLQNSYPDIETICCDLTNNNICTQALGKKSVDIVINNAGITHFSLFEDTAPATIEKVMAVNFFAAVNVTNATLPALLRSKGTVVAISSVAGFSPLYGRSGYSASKHALHGFFNSLRSELQDKSINIMIACPSFIATQKTTRTGAAEDDISRPGSASQTAGKALRPEDVAIQICHGIEADRRQITIGTLGKLSYWINKLFPRQFEKLMIRKMRSEF